jgi:hypothetical protein
VIYAVLGYEPVDFLVLKAYAKPGPEVAVTEWASLYARLCPVAGVRTSFAWAQACHETGYFTYPATANARAEWNNPAGLGVTGAPDTGNRFVSKEDGVRAHLGHLLWYFGPFHPVTGFCDRDQRHFGDHWHLENDGSQLGGRNDRGIKWAPGTAYGATILVKAIDVLTRQV